MSVILADPINKEQSQNGRYRGYLEVDSSRICAQYHFKGDFISLNPIILSEALLINHKKLRFNLISLYINFLRFNQIILFLYGHFI